MVWWATGCAVNEQTKIKIRSTSVGHKCFPLTGWSAYLSECPLGGADLIHHPKWNADHGGESKQPADHISPPRVHILIVVLQRSVFNEGECKGALQRQGNRVRQLVRINLLYFLFFFSTNRTFIVIFGSLSTLLRLTMHVAGEKNNQQHLIYGPGR